MSFILRWRLFKMSSLLALCKKFSKNLENGICSVVHKILYFIAQLYVIKTNVEIIYYSRSAKHSNLCHPVDYVLIFQQNWMGSKSVVGTRDSFITFDQKLEI